MRKIVICLTSLFFVYQSSLYAYSSNPKEFVFELVNEAISILSDKSLTRVVFPAPDGDERITIIPSLIGGIKN